MCIITLHTAGLNITVGHRPFSEHAQEMTGYTWHLPVKMASRNVQVLVLLALILASLRRKTGARLLLGPSKNGKSNTTLTTRV